MALVGIKIHEKITFFHIKVADFGEKKREKLVRK